MKKRINKKGLLEVVFFEQESMIPSSETDPIVVPKDVSLDQKVDKYLVRYERESVPTSKVYAPPSEEEMAQHVMSAQQESKNIKKGLLESFLFEAEPDDASEDPTEGLGGGEEVTDPGLDSDASLGDSDPLTGDLGVGMDAPETPIVNTPKINLNDFARAVSRLINNYEALLSPKVTILNRALEYIKVNYDDTTSKMLEEILSDEYDLHKQEPERNELNAPLAVGATGGGG